MLKWVKRLFESRSYIPENDGHFWQNWHASINADAGIVGVGSPRRALGYAAVWQAVSLLSGDIASLPVVITDDSMDPEAALKDHPAYFLCRRMPSPGTNAFKFWRQLMSQTLIWGNGYAEIVRSSRFRPMELRLIPSEYVQLDHVTGFYQVQTNTGIRNLFPSEVFHLEGIDLGDGERLNLWQLASKSWGLGLAAEEFASAFFRSGALSAGTLEIPAAMSSKARDNLARDFRTQYGGIQNAHKMVMLREGVKFNRISVDPVDAELSILRNQQVSDVARWFNCPPDKLGLPTNVSYSSLIEQQKSYLESCLGPWLRAIQAEGWSKLLTTREQRDESVFVVHDLAPLFSADRDVEPEPEQPRPVNEEPAI